LIQFGEPQARQYGVDWTDPLGSQLGPNGAVARYFSANGWQPGMSILDAYSIVNAGGPGRYSASDANNGGAPGTVADKVSGQFGPHRARAEAMFGGQGAPASSPMQQNALAVQQQAPTSPANALAAMGWTQPYLDVTPFLRPVNALGVA
jgi:hypothetical protein